MDYELAAQLRDAVFRRRGTTAAQSATVMTKHCCPTLSELIEACGDELTMLQRKTPTANSRWHVSGGRLDPKLCQSQVAGISWFGEEHGDDGFGYGLARAQTHAVVRAEPANVSG